MSQAIAPGAVVQSREQVRLLLDEGGPAGGIRGRTLSGFEYPGLRIDRARLDDAHFERMTLTDATFGEADLGRTRFTRVDLRGARFDSAVIVDATFEDCDLTEANLGGVHAERVVFNRGGLANTVLTGGRLIDVTFTEVNLYGAKLDGAALVRCRFSDPRPHIGVELTRASLKGAVLIDCDLAGANLCRADLGSALFIRCNLDGAQLTGAEATGARLVGCSTSGADLPDLLRAQRAESPEGNRP